MRYKREKSDRRAKQMWELWLKGWSFQEIAVIYTCKRQNVFGILNRHYKREMQLPMNIKKRFRAVAEKKVNKFLTL